MGITEIIAWYISENHISVEQIGHDLQIEEEKMRPGTPKVLTGEELLKICQYLRVGPESIMEWYQQFNKK